MSIFWLVLAVIAGVRATVELVDDWSSAHTTAWLAFTIASASMSIHTSKKQRT